MPSLLPTSTTPNLLHLIVLVPALYALALVLARAYTRRTTVLKLKLDAVPPALRPFQLRLALPVARRTLPSTTTSPSTTASSTTTGGTTPSSKTPATSAEEGTSPHTQTPIGTAHKPRRHTPSRILVLPAPNSNPKHPLPSLDKSKSKSSTPRVHAFDPPESALTLVAAPVEKPRPIHRVGGSGGTPCRCRVCRVRMLAGVKADWHCSRASTASTQAPLLAPRGARR